MSLAGKAAAAVHTGLGIGRETGSVSGAAAAGKAASGPKGKYHWHVVVDGLSKTISSTLLLRTVLPDY